VSLGRLRRGEWLALIGAVGLFVVLFLDWFGVDLPSRAELEPQPAAGGIHNLLNTFDMAAVHHAGWTTLGWFLDALLVLSIAGGVALSYMTLRRATPAWPVGASILTVVVAAIAFLVLLTRVLTQPGLGPGLPNDVVTVQLPAYLGLLFAALIPVGAWMALGDERTDAPESAYTPPPARPIPGT
jgi:ABC-type transport system involved in cytochrome c biogenesis permease subunit